MRTKCFVAFAVILVVVLAGGVLAYATSKAKTDCCYPGSPCCEVCCEDCCADCCPQCCEECCHPGCCRPGSPCCDGNCCTDGARSTATRPEPAAAGPCCAKDKKESCCAN
jgi:hypothetical protein